MTKITLPRSEVQELLLALRGLDSKSELIRDAQGKITGTAQGHYVMSPQARYAVAKTIRSIKDEVESQQEARNEMIRTARANLSTNGQAAAIEAKLQKDITAFFREKVEIEVHKFAAADVNTEANQLAGSLLAALGPVLEGE